jgi:hypothetical protein
MIRKSAMNIRNFTVLNVSAALGWLLPGALQLPAATPAPEVVPGDQVAAAVPFLGDWEGQPGKDRPRAIFAQVIPRGGNAYRINFLPAFDQRCPPFAEVDAKAEGGALRFDQAGWSGRIEGELLQGTGLLRDKPGSQEAREITFEMKKTVRPSPRLGAQPPDGAIVLYDGQNLDNLESDGRDGETAIRWQRMEDFLRVWPPLTEHSFGAALRTREAFTDFQLHLEFRLPLIAGVTGQSRANSGVIIEEFEFYELQILDSYGLPGYWDECGAVYNKEAPKVNACRPPGQWQSYDVVYHAPRFDTQGKLAVPARITLDLNGKRIHYEVELPYSANALKMRREKPDLKTPGRVIFQHHGDPVDFRNIWIKDLKNQSPNPRKP